MHLPFILSICISITLLFSHSSFSQPSSLTSSTSQFSSDPYSNESIAEKDYRGVTLKILSHEKPVIGEPTERHARRFEQLTGAKVEIKFVPFKKLYQELTWGLRKQKYDIVFAGSLSSP